MVEKTLNAADRLKKEQKRKEDAKKEEKSSDSEADEEVTPHTSASNRVLEPLDYEGVEEKYGVVFCDTDMVSVFQEFKQRKHCLIGKRHLLKNNLYPTFNNKIKIYKN